MQRNDSGHYMCQINTEPMVSQIGMLEVVEAPDILYNETSNDTITMEGASVSLKCEARYDSLFFSSGKLKNTKKSF